MPTNKTMTMRRIYVFVSGFLLVIDGLIQILTLGGCVGNLHMKYFVRRVKARLKRKMKERLLKEVSRRKGDYKATINL